MEQRYKTFENSSPTSVVIESSQTHGHPTLKEETSNCASAELSTDLDSKALTNLLEQDAKNLNKETWISFAWAGAFLSSVLYLVRFANSDEQLLKIQILILFLIMTAVGSYFCLRVKRRSNGSRRNLTETLKQNYDETQVGPLIRTLRAQNAPVRKIVKSILTDLLPTLKASDSHLISEEERKILLRTLVISPNETGHRDLSELFSSSVKQREMNLRLSILKALQQVGGDQELATVKSLALGTPTIYSFSFPPEIREAAKECLPYMQARSNEQRDASQLLRASSVHDISGETLLRPATSSSEFRPELLLRASEPPL